MSNSEKIYMTTNIGFAAFLTYLDDSSFLGAEQPPGKGVRFVFRDTATDDTSCSALEKMYFSIESVQLRNAREYSQCVRAVSDSLKMAYKAEGERVRV